METEKDIIIKMYVNELAQAKHDSIMKSAMIAQLEQQVASLQDEQNEAESEE